jgi:predicted ATP-grasp superfamily ATP-dependent carboligase
VETFVDKWQFTALLRREHIPHPRTLLLRSRQEAESLDEAEFEGSILKPVSSVHFSRKHGVKGYLVNTREEAVAILRKISFPIMLQQYIPGPSTASFFIDGFVDRHGRVLARFARRRLRIYPDKLGNSSLMVSVPLQEVAPAVQNLDRLLQAVAYRGIFSAEFKYDQRDGVFKILEVNPRPWWYIEFAARCGVDVCTLAYRDALGLPQQAVQEYQVGRRCVFLANDYRAYRDMRGQDRMSLWSWIASWAGADEALFRWTDPRPSFAYFVDALKPRVEKRSDEPVMAEATADHRVVT